MESRIIYFDARYSHYLINMFLDPLIEEYSTLLAYLNGLEFVPIMELDENRVNDVFTFLRDKYIDETGNCPYPYPSSEACSILEVLMALTIRFAEDIGDLDWEDLFWTALKNGGFLRDDFAYDNLDNDCLARDDLLVLADRFISRNYDGREEDNGCLFPTKSYSYDLRYLDLWKQLGLWYDENERHFW